MEGNPWLQVQDVTWGVLWAGAQKRRGEEEKASAQSWVSRAVALQLSWAVEASTEVLRVRLGVKGDEWDCELRVHGGDEPALSLGDDAIRAMAHAGWKTCARTWEHGEEERVEPREEGGEVRYGEKEIQTCWRALTTKVQSRQTVTVTWRMTRLTMREQGQQGERRGSGDVSSSGISVVLWMGRSLEG